MFNLFSTFARPQATFERTESTNYESIDFLEAQKFTPSIALLLGLII